MTNEIVKIECGKQLLLLVHQLLALFCLQYQYCTHYL